MRSDDSKDRFSERVAAQLRKSGWHEGRDVGTSLVLPPCYPLFPAAEQALAEFGGLHFGTTGSGIDCATSDVEIDPSATAHLIADITRYQRELGMQLYPLGEVHLRHAYLLIDEQGKVYLLNDTLLPVAKTFEEGLEKLLLGLKRGFGD